MSTYIYVHLHSKRKFDSVVRLLVDCWFLFCLLLSGTSFAIYICSLSQVDYRDSNLQMKQLGKVPTSLKMPLIVSQTFVLIIQVPMSKFFYSLLHSFLCRWLFFIYALITVIHRNTQMWHCITEYTYLIQCKLFTVGNHFLICVCAH